MTEPQSPYKSDWPASEGADWCPVCSCPAGLGACSDCAEEWRQTPEDSDDASDLE